MEYIYQLIYNSKALRFMLYPFWMFSGSKSYFAILLLLFLATVIVGMTAYRISRSWPLMIELGSSSKVIRFMLGLLAAAIFWLLLDWLPSDGQTISQPSQILYLGTLFWFVVIVIVALGAIVYKKRNIIVSRGKEYKDIFVRGTRKVGEREFNQAIAEAYRFSKDNSPKKIQLGKIVLPPAVESYHISVAGTTGAGKSQVMFQIYKVIDARQENALVFDIGGDFARRFKRPQDKIFNPFDANSIRWNPLLEIREKRDCATLAAAITAVNESDVSGKRWADYSKAFLTAILEYQFETGSTSIAKFLYYAFEAERDVLIDVLAGTTAAAYVQDGNEEVFQSIRTTAVNKLESWKYLIHNDNATPDFSIREWILQQPAESIFIAVRDSDLAALKEMVSCFYAVAFQEALDVPRFDKRFWIFLDEVDSLGYIVSLRHGLTKLRKHNATIVLGFQAISQLRATYGQQITDTLHVNTRVQISMAVTGDTAKYFSEVFGSQEVNRLLQTTSENSGGLFSGNNSSSVANNVQRITGKTILDSEFSSLPNLTGYIRLIGLPVISRFTVPFSE